MEINKRNIFFYLACIGWLYALGGHLLSFSGAVPGPQFWILGAGVFVVWIAFILRLRRENPQHENPPGWRRSQKLYIPLNRMFIHAPAWLKVLAVVSFVYAIANFIFGMITRPADLHGTEITPHEMRIFTGHWMMFYAIAAAGLFPEKPKVF